MVTSSFILGGEYRAQLAGAVGVTLVQPNNGNENDYDLVPYYKIHDIWDEVSNGKKLMPACTVCVCKRVFVVSMRGCQVAMPKHAALAFRSSVGAPLKTLCLARSLSQSHIQEWGASVTIPFFVMSGGDGRRVKDALAAGERLRVQALLEPWQGKTGGVWDGFQGIDSASCTCSASEMVGACDVPYEFNGLSRGEGGVESWGRERERAKGATREARAGGRPCVSWLCPGVRSSGANPVPLAALRGGFGRVARVRA